MSAPQKADDAGKALAWMTASALGFSLMSIFVKRIGSALPEFELVFFRSVINLCWALLVAGLRGQSFRALVHTPGKPLLMFRGLVGLAGVSCLFYGLRRLPLPIATLLNWCSPIFVIIFSRWFLKEKTNAALGLWGTVAFCGLLMLIAPNTQAAWNASAKSLSLVAVGVTLVGAAFGGMAYVAVRAATAKASPEAIVIYFMVVSTVVSAPLALRDFVWPESSAQWWNVLALGSFAAWGQVTMTHAYRYAPAAVVSLMNLLNPIFGALFGFWLFNEWLSFSQGLGMILILCSVGVLAWQSNRA